MRLATTEYAENGVATLARDGFTITGIPVLGSKKYSWSVETPTGEISQLPQWSEPRMWLWAQGFFAALLITAQMTSEAEDEDAEQ